MVVVFLLIFLGMVLVFFGFCAGNAAFYAEPGHRLEAIVEFFDEMFEGGGING